MTNYATDICSDKTGTLTQGKMVAKKAWIPAKGTYSVGPSNQPMNPTEGTLSHDTRPPKEIDFKTEDEKGTTAEAADHLHENSHLEEYLKVASLANLAVVQKNDDGEWKARGDPTEIAIQVFASRYDWNRSKFVDGDNPHWVQMAEFPFDSDVKKMSVIFKESKTGDHFVFTKGAVERVIGSCVSIHLDDNKEPTEMSDAIRSDILEHMEALAALGLRVLALAGRKYPDAIAKDQEIDRNHVERDLTFRGLIGLYDPPRPESAPSVRMCHQAGIAVHMLTGDHLGTARSIAAEIGILPSRMSDISKNVADSMVMTASTFDKYSDDEIDRMPVLPLVVARCAPNTKVRMVEALHRRGKFVAMVSVFVYGSGLERFLQPVIFHVLI